MRSWETIGEFNRGPFLIIVDRTYEDMHPRDSFETDDVAEICRKIDNGTYEWFMMRVRAFFDGHEMGSAHLGGCLYEDAREVLTDGTAEDFIEEVLKEARVAVGSLRDKLAALEL